MQDTIDEFEPIQKSHILLALLYIQLDVSVHVMLFTTRNVKGDAMRLLTSHKFVCPCNMFSLLTEVISSVCCYTICSLVAAAHGGPKRCPKSYCFFFSLNTLLKKNR